MVVGASLRWEWGRREWRERPTSRKAREVGHPGPWYMVVGGSPSWEWGRRELARETHFSKSARSGAPCTLLHGGRSFAPRTAEGGCPYVEALEAAVEFSALPQRTMI